MFCLSTQSVAVAAITTRGDPSSKDTQVQQRQHQVVNRTRERGSQRVVGRQRGGEKGKGGDRDREFGVSPARRREPSERLPPPLPPLVPLRRSSRRRPSPCWCWLGFQIGPLLLTGVCKTGRKGRGRGRGREGQRAREYPGQRRRTDRAGRAGAGGRPKRWMSSG